MDGVRADYWSALGEGDRDAALGAVKRLVAAGGGPRQVIDELIVPAQERIGELWLSGGWSIAQEHAATAINVGLVHWLSSFGPHPGAESPLVLVSCADQERHAFPALLIAEGLRGSGFRVSYLDRETDPNHLVRQVLAVKPRAVLLSFSTTSSLASQKVLIGHIRAMGIPVIAGGQALGGDERRALALGATAYAADLDEAVRLLQCLPARGEPVLPPTPGLADLEAAWIGDYRHEIARCVARLIVERHSVEGAGPAWRESLEDHVDHVLGCLAAALVTDDETIMVEVREWLARVLAARGAQPELAVEVWSVLAQPMRGHPLARVFLAGAAPVRDHLGDVADGLTAATA